MRIAVCPCHTVAPHQHVPSSARGAHFAVSAPRVPNETSTWLMTTSFSTCETRGAQSGGKFRAWREVRSRFRHPRCPSDLSAAHSSTPRARRESSGRNTMVRAARPASGTRAWSSHRRSSRQPPREPAQCRCRNSMFGHLCASVAHESASSNPCSQVPVLWRGRRPQSECAIHVDPCAVLRGAATDCSARDRMRRCSRCPLAGKESCDG